MEKVFNTGAEGLNLKASEKELETARNLVTDCVIRDKIKLINGARWMEGVVNGCVTKVLVMPNNFSKKIDLGFKFL